MTGLSRLLSSDRNHINIILYNCHGINSYIVRVSIGHQITKGDRIRI